MQTLHTGYGEPFYLHANGHMRELMTWHDLPARAREVFDYVAGEDRFVPRFVSYHGAFYDVNEFTALVSFPHDPKSMSGILRARGWHGIQTDSAFSATVIRYSDDFESVSIGRIHW